MLECIIRVRVRVNTITCEVLEQLLPITAHDIECQSTFMSGGVFGLLMGRLTARYFI